MNKVDLEVAHLVHDLIQNRIINFQVLCHRAYYGKGKMDQLIDDVNLYLNKLSVERIYSFILGLHYENMEDIINYLILDFNDDNMSIECKIPKKYNTINLDENQENNQFRNYSLVFITIIVILIFITFKINN